MGNGGERKRMPRLVGGSGLEDANSARRVVNPSRVASHESRGQVVEQRRDKTDETDENAENTESTATLSDTCRG